MVVNGDAWLGLEPIVDGKSSFTLTPALVRYDGKLFGGTGLAVTVAAIEAVSERSTVWATVQFVGSANEGDRIDVHVEEVAAGHNTSQVRLTATMGDRLILLGLGAAARRRDDGFGARFGAMPEVTPPESSPAFSIGNFEPPPEMSRSGPFSTADYRVALGRDESQYVWARMHDQHQTHVTLAYLADFVPSAVLRAAGQMGGGTSLDNSIRFGPDVSDGSDWLLIDNDPYFADNGFVHGAARLWTRDGALVGVASQSAVAKIFG